LEEGTMPRSPFAASAILLVAVLASGCRDSPAEQTPDHPLFQRYIALGNSITAAFESEGINDSTQNHSYAVVLAQRFNAPFTYARLRKPGCPAPLLGPIVLTTERVGGARVTDCSLVHLPLPRVNHSLAVPGAKISDVFTVPGSTGNAVYDLFVNEIYRLIFGSRTLVGAMVSAQPTLVSVWLGNNDALSAVTAANPTLLTPLAEFEASVDQLAAAIADQTPVQDVLWLAVLDPQIIPIAQPGAFFWMLDQNAQTRPWLRDRTVNDDCAPLLPGGEPNPLAANLVSGRTLRDPTVTEISCSADAPFVLGPAARESITARVTAFNEAIQARVAERGWIYIDTNEIVNRYVDDPDRIRLCQTLLAARTEAELIAALVASCPYPDAPNFFGSLLTFDGIHPSAEGQRIIADEMEARIRAKHGI
jgi:hypothetical protein